MDKKEKQYLLIAGGALLLIGAYFLLKKKPPVDADLETLKKNGMYPTLNESQAQANADSLDAILDSVYISSSSLQSIFNSCQNLADVLLIIQKYGTHFHFGFGYIGNYSLPEFMTLRLGSTDLNLVNSILTAKNINYKF